MSLPDAEDMEGPEGGVSARRPRRWRTRLALAVAAIALVGGSTAWISRERIATDLIDGYLAERGVTATYDIASLTPRQQVIANLVIGDPARPDLTVRRMVIETGVGWAGPEVRRVRIEGARVYASLRGGKLSLGALDPLVFTGGDEPPRLPAIAIELEDARALVASDFGRVGVALEGAGRLDDGFAGHLAATAPGIGVEGCRTQSATLYAKVTTVDGAPAFDGPLRLAGLACAGASLARADIGTKVSVRPDFTAADADLRLSGEDAAYADLAAAGLTGSARLGWSEDRLAVSHDLALIGVAAPQGRLARLAGEGGWRGAADGSSGQWEGTLRGSGLAPAPGLTTSLAAAERGTAGTLLAPLIAKARTALASGLDGASLRAEAIIRHRGGEASLTIPEARLASRSGTPLAALSRGRAALGPAGLSGFDGDLLAGGGGLPAINARIAQDADADGGWTLRMAMADYAAGPNHLAVPRLAVQARSDGSLAFEGLVRTSGVLPGGGVRDLALPLEGGWSPASGFALGTRCAPLSFDRLALSGLALAGQRVTLCPERGRAMLTYRDSLRLAARTGALSWQGSLGESPASLAAGGLVLRYPQPFAVERLALRIGTGTSEVRLAADSLTGSLSGAPGGSITGGTARLAAVPFDLDAIAGRWTFAEGTLGLADARFTLSDRSPQGGARFAPLVAEGARLTLSDNRIAATARLAHPGSARAVADVTLAHDLDTAAGGARFTVPALVFDKAFQPEHLSYLAKGVIAFADGTLTGSGRVDWKGEDITSSGTFATDGFDFAAAFGPVRGLKGQVVFTDLLNLTTAPDQRVTIAAINPGVEVLAGRVQFEVSEGTRLALEDARFPFMGGTLVMRPLVMDFGKAEERRYVFDITALDAATFVAEMELTNLSATGTFDGTVPIVFDANGRGRIAGGYLVAREGGGNVAYIGELSYEDLGTMGNYAFSALRSLDYRQMRVGLGGLLDGEIITSFEFDGVRQGAGTSQNFVTRRLAKLPILFKINVRSEKFYELATMVRSFWDANYVRRPEDIGLFRQENGRLVPVRPAPAPSVQPPESEDQP